MSGAAVRASAAALRSIAASIVEAAGSEPAEAAVVAEHLVDANLAGHDSHGVGMLPAYVDFVARGVLVPNTGVRVVEDGGAWLRLAGDRGYGQRVGREAMALAIERAREHGVCALALAGSGHLGRIGAYGEQAVEAGLASLHFVNAVDHAPLVAPFGGRDARFATNPLCIALPGGASHGATVVDMATSAVSFGKVRVAHHEGREAPEGALIDADGRPTRDPAVMFRDPPGALLPVGGGHKGHALLVACELLAGVLTGGGTMQPANERRDGIVNHMLAFVLDPARLGDPAWMRRETDALLAYVAASPPADGGPPLQPGEPERRARAHRLAHGIAVDGTTWGELLEAAEAVGLPRDALGAALRRHPVG